MFEVGRTYDRRNEIHGPYGGQWQGGISTPGDRPFVFLFTSKSGEQYGYEDGFDDDGVFLYTGEGQVGDMEFRAGNKAIRDHATAGKDLHLFESLGKGKGYRYLGRFASSSWEFRQGEDRNGDLRRVIVFHLINADDEISPENLPVPTPDPAPLDQLRKRAFEASSSAEKKNPKKPETSTTRGVPPCERTWWLELMVSAKLASSRPRSTVPMGLLTWSRTTRGGSLTEAQTIHGGWEPSVQIVIGKSITERTGRKRTSGCRSILAN